MKELKLILIVIWVILFPIISYTVDLLEIKYKRLRGVQMKPITEDENNEGLGLMMAFFVAGILFIHLY